MLWQHPWVYRIQWVSTRELQIITLARKPKKIFSVHRRAIAKEYLSKNIATQLYNQIEEIAKANNGTSMRIDTAANNIKAQQFFLKQGYSWIGNMKYNDYGHLYSKYYDMLFYCYEKSLSN